MGADTALVARLLERAQCGEADEVLRLSETILREPTGDLADGDAGMHFVRSVALVAQRRTDEALGATELMLRSAEREGSEGWRSCALSLRAWEQLLLDEHTADLEVDAVLQDLVDAEAALENSAEDSVIAENAHTGVGLAYHHLRLYELALPHYEAAYAVSAQDGRQAGNQAMWQGNMAWLHLEWALELARVHLGAEARQHNLEAGVHAALAIDLASGPDAERWREHASLLGGCAAADGPDPATAARSIERYSVMLANRGVHREAAYAQPFLARALSRSGDPERAGEVIERAAADLPTDAGWLTVAALHHTRLTLLATDGDPVIAAALAYGDSLALALWRQRQRTLHTATTLKSYDRLRDEHERMAHTAETDALTTLANRRAFDNAVESIKASGDDRRLAALLIDLDTFKQVNDAHGHAAGDLVLRDVAGMLAGMVREGDLVARLGGDEFAALLHGANPVTAYAVAQRMVQAIDTIEARGVTLSIGVASGTAHDISTLLAAADAAMYVAKRAGGNRAHTYRPGNARQGNASPHAYSHAAARPSVSLP
jgi:diguanylate cyclase (GGDEF)-like protein